MWFRVEFNRDGSIKKSEPVEARNSDSTLVCYVDAESSGHAVKEALAWRRKYLVAASERRNSMRAKAKQKGLCANCLHRPKSSGYYCTICAAQKKAREGQSYKLRLERDSELPAVSEVRAAVKKLHGQTISESAIKNVLNGEAESFSATRWTARALKTLGIDCGTEQVSPLRRGGGRHSSAQVEAAMLCEVKKQYNRLSRADFAKWLDTEIERRLNSKAA